MKTHKYPEQNKWPDLVKRPAIESASLEKVVNKILENVNKKGDEALKKYSKKFDGTKLKNLCVSSSEINGAEILLPEELKFAITQAKKNIQVFHAAQKQEVIKIETMPGVVCWRRSVPIEKVGLYIPGGSAPLFSTVLMLGVPAQMAGCKEIVLCTPPGKDGKINPAILFAAQLCGITKIYKTGGAQAIAAMAYGTKTIPKVFKIFGPGNQYVTCAKQIVQQQGVAIDIPAGPSEVLVIADDTAMPDFIAADLLSQAEHGEDSQVILVTTDKSIVKPVKSEIKMQLEKLPRKNIASKALKNSKVIVVRNIEDAIAFSNVYAPEHLILACSDAEMISDKITAAGSVFIGNNSPESAGDYASGTNHTLPTNGYASSYSGVSLDSFVNKITYQQLSEEGLKNIAATVMVMAEAEGLEAHKNAVAIRFAFLREK